MPSPIAENQKRIRELEQKVGRLMVNPGGKSEADVKREVDAARADIARLEQENQALSKKTRRAVGDLDDDHHVAKADKGPEKVTTSTVSVRALASAYDKLVKEGGGEAPAVAAEQSDGAGGEEELELDDEELKLDEDDELNLDDEELDLDADDGAPAADEEEELELSGDDLDLGDEETAAAERVAGGGDALSAGDLAGAGDDDEELDLDDEELDLDDEEAAGPSAGTVTNVKPEDRPTPEKKVKSPDAKPAPKQTAKPAPKQASKPDPKPATAAGQTQITRGGEGPTVITVQSHALPNNKYLREPFRVIKIDEGALIGSGKKERIWDVDFLARKFSNLDMAGYKSFSQPAANLYRVEKHVSDPRRLILYFFEAPHPYDLMLTSPERRNRFYELAMLQRRNSILWCPSLCPDGVSDAAVKVVGTTIMRPSGKVARVTGEAKMSVARMPYEIIDFWFGCVSLQNKPLPPNHGMLQGFIPKGVNDVYVLGVADIPASLVGKPDIGAYFGAYLGSAFHVLSQTILESKTAADKVYNGILLIVRRSFILRTSNIDAVEIDNLGKDGKKRTDYSLVAAQVRINEALICCAMVNVSSMATSDPNLRSGGIRSLFANLTMGNESLDFGSRYDYLFIGGNFGYADPWGENDGLSKQQSSGNLLQNMKEATPGDALKVKTSSPFRILFEARQGTCRADVKEYYTGTNLPLNNAAVSTDLFTLRTFLSTFGEYVPKAVFKLRDLQILNQRMPNYSAGELHLLGDWIENGPMTVHMKKQSQGYSVDNDTLNEIKPVISNFEFLRLQHLQVSIMGFLPNVKNAKGKPKKLVIASASIPFKNLIKLGESQEFATPLIYRGCVVGSLAGNLVYVESH